MDSRGCRAYQGGMRVQRNANKKAKDKPKPDVVVRCGPTDAVRGRRNFVDDPVVVVEVLSPSTMDVDRGPKLEFYKSLEPLRHIVIVYQDQMRIEHYRRGDDGWIVDTLTKPADVLGLSAVEFQMTFAEAYFDVSIA